MIHDESLCFSNLSTSPSCSGKNVDYRRLQSFICQLSIFWSGSKAHALVLCGPSLSSLDVWQLGGEAVQSMHTSVFVGS